MFPGQLQGECLLLFESSMNKKIILFDGCCNLCNGWIHLLKKWDRKQLFLFISIHSGEGKELINKKNYPRNTVIYQGKDKTYFKSDAVLHILKDLGGPWRIFYFLKIIPRVVRDALYELIARYRLRIFGTSNPCISPEEG